MVMKWSGGFSEESADAEQGDTEAAFELLDLFASVADDPEGIHPDLIGHIAECIRRWRDVGYLLAYNLVCALMTRAAAGAGVTARSLSFKGSLQLFLAFEQQLRFGAGAGVRTMTAHLLGAISMLRLPIRPGRVEPHAIKRRPKNHQLLTVPRDVARANIIRSRPAMA